MTRVLSEVTEGLRDSERTVAVKDIHGRRQFLRVEKDFLSEDKGASYLPVGVVWKDEAKNVALIELPHEADSGVNRLWVPISNLLQ